MSTLLSKRPDIEVFSRLLLGDGAVDLDNAMRAVSYSDDSATIICRIEKDDLRNYAITYRISLFGTNGYPK